MRGARGAVALAAVLAAALPGCGDKKINPHGQARVFALCLQAEGTSVRQSTDAQDPDSRRLVGQVAADRGGIVVVGADQSHSVPVVNYFFLKDEDTAKREVAESRLGTPTAIKNVVRLVSALGNKTAPDPRQSEVIDPCLKKALGD